VRGSNIQHWYNVHDKTPFFVPKETHEEDKADRRPNKRSDMGVVIETPSDEYICDHEEAREKCGKVSPEWGYLHGISNEMLQRQGRILTPHSSLLPS